MCAENHSAANQWLIDGQAGLATAACWGGGLVAAVDGTRFVVPVRSCTRGRTRSIPAGARARTLAMVADFEANLIRLRTREGMAVAKRKGKLRGKQPKLPESAQRSIRSRYAGGGLSLADLAEEYSVGRSTIHGDPATDSHPSGTTGPLEEGASETGPMPL